MAEKKVVILRIEPGQIPEHPGEARELHVPENILELLDGWSVTSHHMVHALGGELLLSLYAEKN